MEGLIAGAPVSLCREITDLAYCEAVGCVITASRDTTIKVWDKEWHIRIVFVGHTGEFSCPGTRWMSRRSPPTPALPSCPLLMDRRTRWTQVLPFPFQKSCMAARSSTGEAPTSVKVHGGRAGSLEFVCPLLKAGAGLLCSRLLSLWLVLPKGL